MFREIRAAMVLKGITAGELAEKIGISKAAFSQKMNGKRDWKIDECFKVQEILAPEKTLDQLFRNADR